MDPPNAPAEYRASLRDGHARLASSVVIAAAVLLVSFAYLGSLTGDGTADASPSISPAVAAATPGRSLGPTPPPTPGPTFAPTSAPSTTAELAPTGVLVADTGDATIGQLVADVNGTIWTLRAGGIANIDPLTGRTRVWTLADDSAFAAASIAPARGGGVWLVNVGAVRLFDGERFRAVIDTPIPLWAVAEGANGSLWAATGQYGLIRWINGVWASDPPGRPTRGAFDVLTDAAGRVWTHNFDPLASFSPVGGVSVWDGIAWTTFSADDMQIAPGLGGWPQPLVAGGDGSVWAFGQRLARFDGHGWTSQDVAGLEGVVALSAVGDDGRFWFVRQDCVSSCGVQIEVYDGSLLTVYDDADGLPGANGVGWPGATVLPGPGYVVAATDAGLYSLVGGTWERLETSVPPGSPGPESGPQGVVLSLAAVSRDEVWAVASATGGLSDAGLFRFDGEAWHREQLPAETTVGVAVVTADGSLWLATGAGPLVRRDGAWIHLGDTVASVLAGPGEAGVDCGGTVFVDGDGTAIYAGPRSGNQLVTLRPVGDTWEPSLHPVPRIARDACNPLLTVTADGTVWLLQRWGDSRFVRSAGGPWESVVLPRMDEAGVDVDPTAIVLDQAGSLLVAVTAYEQTAGVPVAAVLQPFNGHWAARGGDPGIPYVSDLALLPDGSPIAAGLGLSTLEGQRWRPSWPDLRINAISVAPDGTVWVAGPNVYRLPPP